MDYVTRKEEIDALLSSIHAKTKSAMAEMVCSISPNVRRHNVWRLIRLIDERVRLEIELSKLN